MTAATPMTTHSGHAAGDHIAGQSDPRFGLSELGQAALDYAVRYGWAVFPLQPKSKKPLTLHGFKDASTNPDQIREWWMATPNANIGIATGAVSGIVVVDFDDAEAWSTFVAEYGAQATPCSLTGHGRHLLFEHPGETVRNSVRKLSPNTDIRGDGGYIVAPPSIHPETGQPYAWDLANGLDPLLVGSLSLPPRLREALVGKAATFSDSLEIAASDIPNLDQIPKGQRNDLLTRYAGRLLAKGHSPDETLLVVSALNEAKAVPRLSGGEVRAIVASVSKLEAAKSAQSIEARLNSIAGNVTSPRFRLLTVAELELEPDLEWQVEGLLPRRSYGEVFGASGCGKTFLVLDLCLRIASGLESFCGRKVSPGHIVYVAAEGRLKERVAAWRQAHPNANLDNFRVVQAAPNLASIEEATALARDIEQAVEPRIDLLVLDTWSRVTPHAEENSRKEMGAALEICLQVAKKFDAGLLIIHHTGSSPARAESPRGSTVLFAAADYAWLVSEKKGLRTLKCMKMRDAEPFVDAQFRIRPCGRSCVVIVDNQIVLPEDEEVGLTANQSVALAALAANGAPMKLTAWKNASRLPKTTFHGVRKALLQLGLISLQVDRYVLTSAKQSEEVRNGSMGPGAKVPTSPTLHRSGTVGTALAEESQ